jgi:hypothetical protein
VLMRQNWANADMQAPVRRDGEWSLMKSCNIKVGTQRAGERRAEQVKRFVLTNKRARRGG